MSRDSYTPSQEQALHFVTLAYNGNRNGLTPYNFYHEMIGTEYAVEISTNKQQWLYGVTVVKKYGNTAIPCPDLSKGGFEYKSEAFDYFSELQNTISKEIK